MRPEYDFDYSTAVRGKYYRRLLTEGANLAVLEPDVAKVLRSSAAVNEALRSLLKVSEMLRPWPAGRSTSKVFRSAARVRTRAFWEPRILPRAASKWAS